MKIPLLFVWSMDSTILFLLFPVGLLFPVLGLLYLKFCSYTKDHISNNLLRFNVIGAVGLIFAAVIVSYFSAVINGLSIGWVKFRLTEYLGVAIITFLLVGIPTINALRFIELQVDKKFQNASIRIVLNFIATCLIPFSAFYLMYKQLWNGNLGIQEYLQLAYLFISVLILATIRFIYSYNIQKEKELIRNNESRFSILRELKTKAELNYLHSQVNPHFLYNALNSIAGLAHKNADKTELMALSLSQLFRYSANKEKSDWITIQDELEIVRLYLEVEKIRFEEKLTYSVEIPDPLMLCKIPRFILQPLVENAIKHGFSKTIAVGEIKLKVKQEHNWLSIEVYDSGPPFPEDLNPGFGLQGIYDKLEIMYPDSFELNFSNSPFKKVTIKLKYNGQIQNPNC